MTGPMLPRPGSAIAAGATLPLSFIGVGLVGVMGGAGWLAVAPATLALPHLHPHVIALAHVWLLGALLTICFGAVYQLLPVLANTAFKGRAVAWGHLALHVTGVLAMVHAFAAGQMGLVALGGTVVTAGVGCFAFSVWRTLHAAHRLDPILLAFGWATVWLVTTVIAGVLLATNLRFGWGAFDVIALLRAHAHLGVVGFFITLLQGAMFRLVPMFTLAVVDDLRGIGRAIGLSQAGLLVLAPALAWSIREAQFAGAALLLVSFALSARELRRIYGTRKKRRIEPGLQGFFLGLGLLFASALFGVALVGGAGDAKTALAYGVLAVLGGLLASVEGMLCKIVPFLVWMRVYGPRVGRQPTPQAASLGRAQLEKLWVALHAAGSVVLTLGAAFAHPTVLAIGASVFGVGQGVLLVSLGTVARHLWRPDVGAAAMSRLTPQGLT